MLLKTFSTLVVLSSLLSAADSTVIPTQIISKKGTVSSQDISVLGVKEQTGSQNDWETYIEFTSNTASKQVSIFVFELNDQLSRCSQASLKTNMLSSPRPDERWNFKVKNQETKRYETVIQNGSEDWTWRYQEYMLPSLTTYVNDQNKLLLKLQANRSEVMDVDYLVLELSGCENSEPPVPGALTRYNVQFSQTGNLITDGFDVVEIDMEDTSASDIADLHAQGKEVLCYFSAGSYEEWRSDADAFDPAVLGRDMDGWAGEKWLDISNQKLLMPIMRSRMDRAAAKGCDGVDPDNVDGYSNTTGFELTYADQLSYNIALATEAHKRGLSVALKNDVGQLGDLVDHFDMAVNESCYVYNECSDYSMFVAQNKPVHIIEYGSDRFDSHCSEALSSGYDMILKNRSLDAFVKQCQ
jgi:hypothetical protein